LQGGWGWESLATIPDLAKHPGGEPRIQPGQAQQDLAVRVCFWLVFLFGVPLVGADADEQLPQAALPRGALAAEQEQLLLLLRRQPDPARLRAGQVRRRGQ